MAGTVIVAGARTPIGKLSGALSSLSSTDLGAQAIAGALSRAGLSPEQVDFVLMGQVVLAGAGQLTARQASVKAGIPLTVPSSTINKVCLSGLNTIYLADQMINAGEADIVIAGGMESMTQAPHLLPNARQGYRLGDGTLVDSMMFDGLTCGVEHIAMGVSTERFNAQDTKISRQRQDEFAARSHQLAAAAIKSGALGEEIVPAEVPSRRGDPTFVEFDEGVRAETTVETLGKLRASFGKGDDATVTAGNASQISDGASAVIVMSKAKADELGLAPLGELLSYAQVAGPDTSLLHQPSAAIAKACARLDLDPKSLDLFEINEAFAAVGLASVDDLGVDLDKVNPNGGAIALGHPIGMSGNRLALTALFELRRRGGGTAAVALCGGGGQGDAAVLRVS